MTCGIYEPCGNSASAGLNHAAAPPEDDCADEFGERAAVHEYDGRLPRAEAERLARDAIYGRPHDRGSNGTTRKQPSDSGLTSDAALPDVGAAVATPNQPGPTQPQHAACSADHDLDTIDASNEDFTVTSPQAIAALVKENNPPRLFLAAGCPVRIEPSDDGRATLAPLGVYKLRYELARSARWTRRQGKRTIIATNPPLPIVHDVNAHPELPLPVVRSVIHAPAFAPDGTLHLTSGYSTASQLYLDLGDLSPLPVPDHPTQADAAAAAVLLEPLAEFPFDGDADRAHALAFMVLPFARSLIAGPTPLHLVNKPTPGSGASLLGQVMTYPAAGRPVAAMT